MKKAVSILLMAVMAIALGLSVSASSGEKDATLYYRDIKITLNGKEIVPVDASGNPVEPFIIDGTTYLPVRAVAGALGLEVGWDGSTSTVLLGTGEHASVYITRTGSKYHYDDQCNGGTYWPVPFDTAVGMGLQPCDKCVLTTDHPNG